MLLKCCTQYTSKFGKLSSGHRTGEGQFSFQSQRMDVKECSNYCTVSVISHASKVMLKILQAKRNISEICICYKQHKQTNKKCILRHLERIRASQVALGIKNPSTNGGRHEKHARSDP